MDKEDKDEIEKEEIENVPDSEMVAKIVAKKMSKPRTNREDGFDAGRAEERIASLESLVGNQSAIIEGMRKKPETKGILEEIEEWVFGKGDK